MFFLWFNILGKTPTFSLSEERSFDGSPKINIVFANGKSDTLILTKFDNGEENKIETGIEECRLVNKLVRFLLRIRSIRPKRTSKDSFLTVQKSFCFGFYAYLCDNYLPQLWVEFDDELSWLFTKRFRAFYLICWKKYLILNIFVIPIFLTFIYLVLLNLLVNNQLNSSSNSTHLQHIILKLVLFSNLSMQVPWTLRKRTFSMCCHGRLSWCRKSGVYHFLGKCGWLPCICME